MSTNHDGQVWIVITQTGHGEIRDLEILDQPPAWDLSELGQVCYTGNVNGGDSVRWAQ